MAGSEGTVKLWWISNVPYALVSNRMETASTVNGIKQMKMKRQLSP